jgi:two-component system nitrogen regulation sensor histidine kinase NtrY
MNLLDNAVAAVADHGEIKIATSHDPSRGVVYLEVADNGCGVAPEVRARICEPYFSTKKNGTGLGLTIVSQIIEDHRGYIRVRPNEPRGAKFIIEFPAQTETRLVESEKKAVYS